MLQTVPTTTPFTGAVGLQCVTGRFNLLFFIQGQAGTTIFPPVGGGIVGQIQPLTGGSPIPVIQTGSINIPLSQVDNQIVTLCGVFTFRQGQVVLDVRLVQRFTPTVLPPVTVNLQQLLLLLLLLGAFGQAPFGIGSTFGLGGLGGLNLGALGGLGTLGLGGVGLGALAQLGLGSTVRQ